VLFILLVGVVVVKWIQVKRFFSDTFSSAETENIQYDYSPCLWWNYKMGAVLGLCSAAQVMQSQMSILKINNLHTLYTKGNNPLGYQW
jgi:hypothetical protein